MSPSLAGTAMTPGTPSGGAGSTRRRGGRGRARSDRSVAGALRRILARDTGVAQGYVERLGVIVVRAYVRLWVWVLWAAVTEIVREGVKYQVGGMSGREQRPEGSSESSLRTTLTNECHPPAQPPSSPV